jgi:hypothetical protein
MQTNGSISRAEQGRGVNAIRSMFGLENIIRSITMLMSTAYDMRSTVHSDRGTVLNHDDDGT